MGKMRIADLSSLEQYLGVKKWTIYSWVSRKRIPRLKCGRLLRFDLDEIDRWLKGVKIRRKRGDKRGWNRHQEIGQQSGEEGQIDGQGKNLSTP